ncbi:ABC transporter substrate-binding protein [Nocardioides sp. LHD-245]|uniref:ABC transporter substrate-binding protein n=1 Tax=Nocardioides sp. LHD-245 TaxID=3051387 RepID=UPI0027E17D63|nr:ABC transporter substrate-binding protein [Nocardioides sp. LHD-245]
MLRTKIVVALAALAVLASACAGGTDSAKKEDGSYVIKYMQASDSFAYLPFFVALNEGYFDGENVEIDRQPNVGQSAEAAQAVSTGAVGIGSIGTTGAYAAESSGRDLVGLATMTKQSLIEVVLSAKAADKAAKAGVTPDSPIEDRIDALKGLKIAIVPEGSISRVQFEAALREYGVDPDKDATLLPIQDPAALVASVREGQADAFVFTLPNTRQAAADDFGVTWISYPRGDVPVLKDQYLIDIVATKAYVEKNKEAVEAFMRAIWKAVELIKSDPDKARAAAKESFPDMEDAIFDPAFDASVAAFTDGLVPEEAGFQATFDLFNGTLDKPTELDFATAYDTEIVESTQP